MSEQRTYGLYWTVKKISMHRWRGEVFIYDTKEVIWTSDERHTFKSAKIEARLRVVAERHRLERTFNRITS